MRDMLIDAINNRRVLSFNYDGFHRVVEPHTVGKSTAGKDVLSCFQTEGGHVNPDHEWDLCEFSKIKQLNLTGNTFVGERPGYRRGDKRMVQIYAEL
ncbi:hypothetical protein AWB71_00309 [Caballeronia peredens]|nr:hypothetical protein AWB71_00309 [Caballeronia peredens]